jgi:AbrB family looped-hinge helix DNA binding protein
MATEAKISTKGQIVIPKDVRDRLGLKPGDKVKIEVLEGRRAIIQPAISPPKEIFVKAGSRLVEETLKETKRREEEKISRLLKALGVKY